MADLKSLLMCEKCHLNNIEYIYPLNINQHFYKIESFIERCINNIFSLRHCDCCGGTIIHDLINEFTTCICIYCSCNSYCMITTLNDHKCDDSCEYNNAFNNKDNDAYINIYSDTRVNVADAPLNERVKNKPYYAKNSKKINEMLCSKSTIYSSCALLLCKECVNIIGSNQLTPILLNNVSMCSCIRGPDDRDPSFINSEGKFCCDKCCLVNSPTYQLTTEDHFKINSPIGRLRGMIIEDIESFIEPIKK